MELIAFFDKFLADTVNLNQSSLDILSDKVSILDSFFKSNDMLKKYYIELLPQGSYGQKTIIKPPKDKDFDVDVLLSLQSINGWQPKDYVVNVHAEFIQDGNYKKIIELNSRCVTIHYSGDFHVDIVPFLKINGKHYITNKDDNRLEKTKPIAYTEWLMKKNAAANSCLIKVIRLAKYLRDIKENFSVKSILLNTLIGNCVADKEALSEFTNLPTTFLTIFTRLNTFLQNNLTMPIVKNPTLLSEDFNRHWDQKKYSNFREKTKLYFDKTKAAYDEVEKEESIKKWQAVFGDDFPSSVVDDEKAKSFSVLASKSKPWGN